MVNRPTINKIDVFDASMLADIEFCWQGIQPYASRLYIYESDTSSESSQPVFTQYCESIRLRQQIPANTLKNSHSYYAVIILYDSVGNPSEMSYRQYFSCYSAPALTFTGLETDGSTILNVSGFNVTVTYSQAENRPISEYSYTLYDSYKTPVYSSGSKYQSAGDGNIITCPLRSLISDCTYYFSIDVISIDNVCIHSPLIEFSVYYSTPASCSALNAVCDRDAGYVKYSTNIIDVQGHSSGEYVIDNGILNIISGTVYYNTGFSITSDFTFAVRFMGGTSVCLYSSPDTDSSVAGSRITLSSLEYEGRIHYRLSISDGVLPPVILYSDFYDKDAMRTVYVRRKNNLYSLYVATGGEI